MNILKPKTKKEKNIQLAVILVLSAIILYLLWTKVIKPRMGNNSGGDYSASGTDGKSSNANCNDSTVLKKGSSCKEQVKKIQTLYNENTTAPLEKLVVDGVFGSKTERAVEMFTGAKFTTVNDYKNVFNLMGQYSFAS